ncbi:MAG: rod shape-determining protein MreC [Ruminococcus sp.]|jgi:rod shape-determining protein MreC|nr:rod shape-determining protein MreC [Ruminococcus sp.]
MREFFRTRKFKVLAALTAVILGVMIFTIASGENVPTVGAFFSVIAKPFQSLSMGISDSFSETFDTLSNARQNREENILLKEQLSDLYEKTIEYEALKRENEELRTLLSLKEEHNELTFAAPASVIARTVGDPYFSFTIDRGSDDGIAPYDTAVTKEGIVGVCVEVAATTAKIQTLYSPKSAVGVMTARSLTKGIIESDYEYIDKNSVKMAYIDKAADIKVGDIVMTEGSEMFPPGQMIGIVREITMEQNGLAKYARVELMVEPRAVNDVFIITDFNGKGEVSP